MTKMAFFRASTPCATITIKGSALPDNMYYELDVTDLEKSMSAESTKIQGS